ncbi:DUF86 domain-containing protein [Cytobacillus oceanisediminis]|uniref:DUF86 domain-containing protein n=2 Tax=Niallia TaxID=2837506 RepID=A0A941GHM8_NIACI|nr:MULTISPECIES: DUF86 domain-containing protein [Bacillaceae]EOR24208.1 hypothetical protein A499_08754 [Niallia nealsonii AAU1]MBQ6448870.1 DUF86 domain-containing protein [Bacillus sp. (in: firmicutes)]MDU1847162.1 DUF86 domain-containing protein [Niallia nealsonii]MBZ9536836.1 DUF86 domain-containing protein [Cytobacillus oceanisediminis]MCB5236002.1 DUF86 domain-containing protein [Niallia circulans]
MYFVDREKIEEQLTYYHELISQFEKQDTWSTFLEKVALERITHMMIEVILDVGNSMIDGFIMRDPGSYDDIVDILIDEKVITQEIGEDIKGLILWRKQLVHQYTNIDHTGLVSAFEAKMLSIKAFPPSVSNYLTHELGPVSAFKN